MKYTYEEIAGMIDHSLLHPTMTDKEMERECKLATRYKVASVCIKPYAVKMAARILKGTSVAVGAVVGFPHGGNMTKVKVFETEQACEDGATEIDMVINIGKALSGDWDYVQKDIRAVVRTAQKRGSIVKVIIENDFIPNDRIKKKLCRICETAKADYVKTSTGYGFVKGKDGRYGYEGATENDLQLMRKTCSSKINIKAAGGIRDLDALMHCRDLGVRRVGASATKTLLDDYKARARAEKNSTKALRKSVKETKLGGGGY